MHQLSQLASTQQSQIGNGYVTWCAQCPRVSVDDAGQQWRRHGSVKRFPQLESLGVELFQFDDVVVVYVARPAEVADGRPVRVVATSLHQIFVGQETNELDEWDVMLAASRKLGAFPPISAARSSVRNYCRPPIEKTSFILLCSFTQTHYPHRFRLLIKLINSQPNVNKRKW